MLKTSLLRFFSYFAGAFCFVLVLVTLIGWYSHNPSITVIIPSSSPVRQGTGLCFLLAGLSLFLLNLGYRRANVVLNSLILAISLFVLSEYMSGYQLGIGRHFLESFSSSDHYFSGRMSPNIALAFLLFSFVSFLLSFCITAKPPFSAWSRASLFFVLGLRH